MLVRLFTKIKKSLKIEKQYFSNYKKESGRIYKMESDDKSQKAHYSLTYFYIIVLSHVCFLEAAYSEESKKSMKRFRVLCI